MRAWVVALVVACARTPAVDVPRFEPPPPDAGMAVAPPDSGISISTLTRWKHGHRIFVVIDAGWVHERAGEHGAAASLPALIDRRPLDAIGATLRVSVGPASTTLEVRIDDATAIGPALDAVRGWFAMAVPDDGAPVRVPASAETAAVVAGTALEPVASDARPRLRAWRDRMWVASRTSIIIATPDPAAIPADRLRALHALPRVARGDDPDMFTRTGARGTVVINSDGDAALDYVYLVPRHAVATLAELGPRLGDDLLDRAMARRATAAIEVWKDFVRADVHRSAVAPGVDALHVTFAGPVPLAWLAANTAPALAGPLGADDLERARTAFATELADTNRVPRVAGIAASPIEDVLAGDRLDADRNELSIAKAAQLAAVRTIGVVALADRVALAEASVIGSARAGDPATPASLRATIDWASPAGDVPAFAPASGSGRITRETHDDDGTTFSLANGATVRLEKQGELAFEAWSPGGALAGTAAGGRGGSIDAALAIPVVVAMSGVGSLDAGAVHRLGVWYLVASVDAHRHGFEGRARDYNELERMMQLVAGLMAAPVRDDVAIEAALAIKFPATAAPASTAIDGGVALDFGVARVAVRPTADDAWRAFRARYGHARGFTFTFYGVDPSIMRPLIERYLAPLPAGTADPASGAATPRGSVSLTARGARCGLDVAWIVHPRGTDFEAKEAVELATYAIRLIENINTTSVEIPGVVPRAYRLTAGTTWDCGEPSHALTEAKLRSSIRDLAAGRFDEHVRDWMGQMEPERIRNAAAAFGPGGDVVVARTIAE